MHWYWEMALVIALLVYVVGAAIAWQLVYRFAAWRLTRVFAGGWVENQVLWMITVPAGLFLPVMLCTKEDREPILEIIRAAFTGQDPRELRG